MTVMLHPTVDELTTERSELLASLRLSEDELRSRADRELLTSGEWHALRRLDQIAFLLGESDPA